MPSNIVSHGETAGEALTRFATCTIEADGELDETDDNTEEAYCVVQTSASAQGDEVDAVVKGKTKAIAGGSVSKGDVLMPAANGKVVADDGTTASRHLIGRALEGADADGDIVEIDFDPDSMSQ